MVAVGALVLGLAVGAWLSLANHRPVGEALVVAQAISSGDPAPRIAVGLQGSEDEVDDLLQVLVSLGQKADALRTEVEASHETLATVLASVDDGMLVLSPDQSVQLANPATERILSLPEGKAQGHSLAEVARDHELVRLVQSCQGSRSGRPPSEPSERLLDVGFPRRHLRVQTASLAGGRILVVLQDLTELRRADTMRRDFVANVSHELRTPLASLKALVETLQDGALEDTAAAQEFLSRMDVEIDGLTQLVRELLELSRIEAGRAALQLSEADVGVTLAEAAQRLRAQADRAGITLTVDVAPGLPAVAMDAQKIQQALINLIHNAIKFTAAGGHVAVRANPARLRLDGSFELLSQSADSLAPNHVVLSVEDDGVGIAASDLPRIFERFYKVDRARSSGGTGLGLAIVKHVAQAHGGRVWAESVEGEGATFRIALPVSQGR